MTELIINSVLSKLFEATFVEGSVIYDDEDAGVYKIKRKCRDNVVYAKVFLYGSYYTKHVEIRFTPNEVMLFLIRDDDLVDRVIIASYWNKGDDLLDIDRLYEIADVITDFLEIKRLDQFGFDDINLVVDRLKGVNSRTSHFMRPKPPRTAPPKALRSDIKYGDKFYGDDFEYRFVYLPMDLFNIMLDRYKGRLLSESDVKDLRIPQSPGWENVLLDEGNCALLFRRNYSRK